MLKENEFKRLISEPTTMILTDTVTVESYQPTIRTTPDEMKMHVIIDSGYKYSKRIPGFITKDLPATRDELMNSVREAIEEYTVDLKNDMLTMFNKAR